MPGILPKVLVFVRSRAFTGPQGWAREDPARASSDFKIYARTRHPGPPALRPDGAELLHRCNANNDARPRMIVQIVRHIRC